MAPEEENRDPARSPEPGTAGAEGHSPDKAPADLQAECKRLREEVRQLKQERDEYRHQLYQAMAQYFDAVYGELTEEKLLHMIANEKWVPFEDVIRDLEQIAKEK